MPARVIVLFIVATLPDAAFTPAYLESQFAAVVGVAMFAVKIADVPAPSIVIVLAPDDSTVTRPVDLFIISKD